MSRHQGPTCRLIVDLSGVDWGEDRERATAKLLARPGVLAVEVDPDRRRGVVAAAGSDGGSEDACGAGDGGANEAARKVPTESTGA